MNPLRGFGGAVLLALAGWLPIPFSAAAVSLTPVADTYIRENLPDTPHGTTNNFITNLGASTTNKRWSYLRFDLTGFDMANLKEARLDLWNTGAGGAASLTNVFLIDTDGSPFSVGTIGPQSGYGNQHYDGNGQQALGAAFAGRLISTLPRPQLQPPAKSGNGWSLTFTGSSGLNYFLDRATNLPVSWTTLTNIVLGPTTVSNFLDVAPPEGGAFYRLRRN